MGRGTGRRPVFGPLTEDQTTLEGPWERKESNALCWGYAGSAPGPTSMVCSTVSALDLFCRFFVVGVWDLLVTETNRYAAQTMQNGTHTHPRPWSDIEVVEMKAFVGILMLMGICKLPRLEMYWSTQHHFVCPSIWEIMTKTRFQQIFRFLHLANSNDQVTDPSDPRYDRLFKVRNLMDLLSPSFLSQYNAHEQLSVDEAMIPFKGRLGFKQYMKDKPTKWGIKVFVLSDAVNGYVCRIQVYTGKVVDLDRQDVGLCTRVVLELLDGLEANHPKIYMDNYYTSPTLFLALYRKGVNACGTARANRKYYPKALDIKKGEVERGYYDYRSSGPLMAGVWRDKRVIHFMSTIHVARAGSAPATVRRRDEVGSLEDVMCPPCLPDYQQYMRGVDRGDQLIGYYNIGRRSRKWWKRVFSYLVEVAALNAYVLEKHTRIGTNKRDYLAFRLALAEELVGSFRGRSRVGRPRSLDQLDVTRMDASRGHLPELGSSLLDCVVCLKVREIRRLSRSQYRHESKFRCSVCNVHLCISKERNCFKKYHTLVRYWT